MRVQVESPAGRAEFEEALAPVVERWDMTWHLDEVGRPLRTLVLASTAGHCVNDLLFRQRAGQLPVEIPLVLSNHGTLRDLVDFYGVPFESLAVTDAASKAAFERACSPPSTSTTSSSSCSPGTCRSSRPSSATPSPDGASTSTTRSCPGFKGANPYRQAHARGVKLIGATAHFVTSDLDEGPIIEQNVVRVDHSRTSPSSSRSARTRRAARSRQAVKWFAERRVLLDGARTIIFR